MEKIIITHPNFQELGEKITSTDDVFHLGNTIFSHFSDGWPNIFFSDVKNEIEGKDIIYIGDFSKPAYLFENYSIIRALFMYKAKGIDIIIPYFPVATMERISKIGEVATSKYFADILGHLPIGGNTKTGLHIFDIHSLEQQFFFNDFFINIELHTCMNLIKEIIKEETIIIFPDQGAKKRFGQYFSDYETLTCSKIRKGEERLITIEDIDLKNKNVIVIDDLIQTGNTIIETAKKLKQLGIRKIDVFATHGVFPNKSFEKLAGEVDTLYITDSISHNYKVENIKILSIYKNIIHLCKNMQ